MSKYVYNYEDIFTDDPDDSSQCIMTIPNPIAEELGLNDGDLITIEIDEGQLILRKNG